VDAKFTRELRSNTTILDHTKNTTRPRLYKLECRRSKGALE